MGKTGWLFSRPGGNGSHRETLCLEEWNPGISMVIFLAIIPWSEPEAVKHLEGPNTAKEHARGINTGIRIPQKCFEVSRCFSLIARS